MVKNMHKEFFALVYEELAAVETTLLTLLKSPVYILNEISENLIQAGGKRLRPALYLLCAKNSTSLDTSAKTTVAAAIELIHMATLVHDDILDNASLRRGLPTAHSIWGRHNGVLAGDYLFAKAFFILSQTDGCTDKRTYKLLNLLINVIGVMCEGEIMQRTAAFDISTTEETYLSIVSQKTAHFIATACEMGGVSAEYDSNIIFGLRRYGYHLGMAFQIIDDILDFTASAEELGKPTTNDLAQGNLTLPVIFALKQDNTKSLCEIIRRRNFAQDKIRLCRELIVAAGGITYSRQAAAKHIQAADDAIPQDIPADVQISLRKLAGHLTEKSKSQV